VVRDRVRVRVRRREIKILNQLRNFWGQGTNTTPSLPNLLFFVYNAAKIHYYRKGASIGGELQVLRILEAVCLVYK
jgi:hypothetical protein